jgi:putative oxidoreductase
MNAVQSLRRIAKPAIGALTFCAPALDLGIRLWVANVFWKSGLTKISSWDSTVQLFTHEYQVPLLSPETAALLATSAELVFPVLLVLGLGARVSAAALFVFNFVAVISYPELNDVGVKDHVYWGILLLVTLLHGPGKLSVDHLIRRRWWGKA